LFSLDETSSQEKALPPPMKRFNSWPIRCHRTWTWELAAPQVPMAVRCPSTRWRWKIISLQFLMFLIRWTSGTTDRVNIYDKLSLIAQDILAAPASQAFVERVFFCVRPAYCWSQKQNYQVIANVSLFETR